MKEGGSGKRIVIVITIIIVVVIAVLGWMIYTGRGGTIGDQIRNILPFGQGGGERTGNVATSTDNGGGGMITGEGSQPLIALRKLHNSPVAGIFSFIKQSTGTTTKDILVRYIERGLGHIYETNMSTLKEERISNETRLKIYEALWGNGGSGVVIRYLNGEKSDVVQTYSMILRDIKNATTTDEGKRVESIGVFLPENITEVAISQEKGDRMFYILPVGDSSVGITAGFDGKKQVQVFDSPLKEWLPLWPNDNLVTLTSKPSQNVPGFMYFLDTPTGKTTKILGGISGLTTLTSPDGKNVLYSESTSSGIGLYVYDVARDIRTRLSLITLPDKCVWSRLKKGVVYCGVPQTLPGASYPDAWYQGTVTFSDDIWMIDTQSGTTTLIAPLSKLAGIDIDATKLILSPDESFLFFVNKKDSIPWSLNLTVDSSQNS
jgi:hypothetical protein